MNGTLLKDHVMFQTKIMQYFVQLYEIWYFFFLSFENQAKLEQQIKIEKSQLETL